LSDGKTLLNQVGEADIVVGSQSTAMVLGLLAKKMVISCIPPGGPGCNLPQKEIRTFRDMVTQRFNNEQVRRGNGKGKAGSAEVGGLAPLRNQRLK
jgi:hypothetical protein